MTVYDGVMGLIVLYTVVSGFFRGATWQIAPIAALVLGYMIALPMSITTAHFFGQPPLNRLFALVTIYLLVALAVYLMFRSFRDGVEKAKLTEFDRHLGAILGGVKGVLVTLSITCVLLIYFAPMRDIILKSESSTIAAKIISKCYPLLPHAMHQLLEPYLHKLGEQLPGVTLEDPHIDENGYERPALPRLGPATSRTQPNGFRDDGSSLLEPTPADEGFQRPTSRQTNRSPYLDPENDYVPRSRSTGTRDGYRSPTPLDDAFPTTRRGTNRLPSNDDFDSGFDPRVPSRRDSRSTTNGFDDFDPRQTQPAPRPRTQRPVLRSAEDDDPFAPTTPGTSGGTFR